MQSAKEKVGNMASVAKEKIQIAKAKAEEKAEKATARTKEERVIADEKEKMKEAEARAQMHAEKASHAAEKLDAKQQAGHHYHVPGTGHATYGSTYGTHDQSLLGGGVAPGSTVPTGTTTSTTTHHQTHHPHPNYNKHY